MVATMTRLAVTEYLCYNNHGYVPFIVFTIRSFPHSCFIAGFVTRVTRQEFQVDQELLTLPKHLISSPVFNGDGVARSFVFCVLFCLSLSVLLAIVFSVLLRFSASYYLFVYRCLFFWPLCSLSFFGFRLLITSLVSLTFSYII
jgi:hypothetical protein